MTAFAGITAQRPAIEHLDQALRSGRVHHAYRFEGPPGVGKEMAALALARALLCAAPREDDGPAFPPACGRCDSCKKAATWSNEDPVVPRHPDLVLLGRGLYPPAAIGRSTQESNGISVEQVRRTVLSRVGYAPHEGRALLFIVRDADELTTSAANALLKTLEEPQSNTYFVLLTSRPRRLLDTIRSRTLPVRFGALPERVVREILEAHGRPADLAPLAEGSASQALDLCEPEVRERREAFIAAMTSAIEAGALGTALDLLPSRGNDRHQLLEQLAFFAQSLAHQARELVNVDPSRCERLARSYARSMAGLRELERNGQPALVMESLITALRSL